MNNPIQITFRDFAPSDAVRSYAMKRAEKLDTFFGGVVRCHVVLEAPHRRHIHGKRYHVRIDLTVPQKELVVSRNPPDNPKHEDLYAAMDDAFDDAERVLEDYAAVLRGETKTRSASPHGIVKKVFRDEGYGFLETNDGRDVYFHRNSVLHDRFAQLQIGTEVRFYEEDGDKGPQASTVSVVGKH